MKSMCNFFAGNISLTLADSNGDMVETTLSQNFEVGQFQHKMYHEIFLDEIYGPESNLCIFGVNNCILLSLLKKVLLLR